MTDERHNEHEVPENWSPNDDTDASWEGIVGLMSEADRPVLPTDSRYQRMLLDIREQSGLSPLAVHSTASFTGWARAVLCDGGPGAQVLRMAAVAGLVWFGVSRPVVEENGARATTPGQAAGIADATVETPEPAAASPMTVDPDRFVDPLPLLEVAHASPHATPPGDVPTSGVGAVMTILPDWREYVSRNEAMAGSIYPVSNSGAVGFGAAGGSTWDEAASTDNVYLREVVTDLQQLRFHSMVNQDEEVLGRIRRMEELLTPLVEQQQALPPETVQAIDTFQRGEEFLSAGRYTDGLIAYAEVRQIVPGSFIAFLAQYQIAGISFVHLRDYDAALEAYRKTMDEYPAHFLSDAHKNHIAGRIEFLTQNRAGGWNAVTLWQDAQLAPPETRVSLLREIVETSPQLPLAADAVFALLDMTVGDPAKPSVMAPKQLVDLCEMAISSQPDSPYAAEIQFVKAETIFRRLLDLEHADVEFRKALEMPGADQVAERTQVRLNQIARLN